MKVAIVGLGLIGGSIALALRRAGVYVIGIPRREETLKLALEQGVIDEGATDHKKGVAEAEIVFICTPINLVTQVIDEIAQAVKEGTIITDVGSSKQQIVAKAESLLPKGIFFIGGHPMAGKEKVKLEEADPELFKDKTYVLTPTKTTDKKALEKLEGVIRLLGSLVVKMEPGAHDLAVAAISHMPLAIAVALVNCVADQRQGQKEIKLCAASGFRDTTRIASGDPILGLDMFSSNKEAVLKMIAAFKASLAGLEEAIKNEDAKAISDLLTKAKNFRDDIYQ